MSDTDNSTERFRFSSEGLPDADLHVVKFSGTEGINRLFCFTIVLVSEDASLDTDALLGSPATLSISREDAPDSRFIGYPVRVRQGGFYHGYSYYTVELRPALWKFTKIVQSAVFLDKDIKQVAAELLGSQKFFSVPADIRLVRTYPKPEFSLQYNESLFEYLCWRLEEQGAYFYFEQDSDKVIFADSPQSHKEAKDVLHFSPLSGLENAVYEEVVVDFAMEQSDLPNQVVVRSYNWTKPDTPIVGKATVSTSGLGDVYLSNEAAETNAEAGRIASIRAEELACHACTFSGKSASPILRPGATFSLDMHPRGTFNTSYLVTEVTHAGSQESFLALGLGIPMQGANDHCFYRNEFKCVDAGVPFRPKRLAKRASIPGCLHAFIDGEGTAGKPEMDGCGRYKVIFPFDVSGRKGGNASCWIRMAKPQVGKDSGMSFPLSPGVEVLISFTDGNPDRPVITGALANGATGTISGGGNPQVSGLKAIGGNQLVFLNADKNQSAALLGPTQRGFMMNSNGAEDTTISSDKQLTAASMAIAEVCGGAKNALATLKNATSALSGPSARLLTISILGSVFPAAQKALDSLAEKKNDGTPKDKAASVADKVVQWGSPLSKLAVVIANTIVNRRIALAAGPLRYQSTTMTSEDDAKGEIATNTLLASPTMTQLLMTIIPWFIKLAGESAGAAGAHKHTPTAKEKEKAKQDAKYDANNTPAPLYSKIVSSVTDLLPDLVAFCLLLYDRHEKPKKLGGVSIKSVDKNVNILAGTVASLQSKNGVYINVNPDEAKFAKNADDIRTLLASYGLPKQPLEIEEPDYTKVIDCFDTLKVTNDGGNVDFSTIRKTTPFVALESKVNSVKSTWSFHKAENNFDLESKNIHMHAGNNKFHIENTGNYYLSSNKKITIEALNATGSNKDIISKIVLGKFNLDLLCLRKNRTSYSSAYFSSNSVNISASSGDNSYTLNIIPTGINLGDSTLENKGSISIRGGNIDIKGKTQVSGVVINNGSISGSKKGLLTVGKSIKIMDCKDEIDLSSLVSKVKELDKKINEERKKEEQEDKKEKEGDKA